MAVTMARQYVREQLLRTQPRLEAKSLELKRFQEQNGVFELPAQTSQAVGQLASLENQRQNIELQLNNGAEIVMIFDTAAVCTQRMCKPSPLSITAGVILWWPKSVLTDTAPFSTFRALCVPYVAAKSTRTRARIRFLPRDRQLPKRRRDLRRAKSLTSDC